VFRADTLENVLVFLAVKAAQRIPAEDIHFEGCAYLVPELFKLDRGVRITFRPQERRTFSTSHNPWVLSRQRTGGCFNKTTDNLEKSGLVKRVIHHESRECFGNIQWNVCPLLSGGTNIQALCLQY
jgi:hypothetical protein